MPRAPREVREERLRRFLKRKEEIQGAIEHYEDLIAKARAAEEAETQPAAARKYIQTRVALERSLSEAKANLLRTTKSIEREREWLARYDEHAETAASIDGEDAEGAGDEIPEEIVLDVLQHVQRNLLGPISLGQMEMMLKLYSRLSTQEELAPPDRDQKYAIVHAMEILDEKLAELRRLWVSLRE